MYFKKEDLLSCLGIIEKALPIKTTPVPLIDNIYFNCLKDEVLFSATNLEMEITCRLPYHNQQSFKLLLPPRIIDIIRYLPDQNVEMIFDLERFSIEIRSGGSIYCLHGADPAEYPVSTFTEAEQTCPQITLSGFKQALRQVVFASSTEEGRPVFTGLLFSFEPRGITITASDTYRVAISNIPVSDHKVDFEPVLIPARSMRELIKILNDDDQQVAIGFHKDQVIFDFQEIKVVTKVLDEKFPDISGIIPPGFKTRLEFNCRLFEETVNRASLLAEGLNKPICFSYRGNESSLQVTSSSQAGKMEEDLEVKAEGEEFQVYLNSRFLLEMMKSIDCEMLSAEFNGQSGPVIFRPMEENQYLYLVLPIKIS